MTEPIYVVMTLARQIHGEYVFIRAEGAFKRASQADELVKKIAKGFVDPEGKPKAVKLSSPMGDTVCFGEVGAFTLDLASD